MRTINRPIIARVKLCEETGGWHVLLEYLVIYHSFSTIPIKMYCRTMQKPHCFDCGDIFNVKFCCGAAHCFDTEMIIQYYHLEQSYCNVMVILLLAK